MNRKTKIIATLGPAVASYEAVRDLVAAGMNVARLNFSHGDQHTHEEFFKWVRRAGEELGEAVAVLQDIQGPKLRVGTFPGGAIQLDPGEEITLVPDDGEGDDDKIHVAHLADADLSPGAQVLMSDGLISLEVLRRTRLRCRGAVPRGGRAARPQGRRLPRHRAVGAGHHPQGRGGPRLR